MPGLTVADRPTHIVLVRTKTGAETIARDHFCEHLRAAASSEDKWHVMLGLGRYDLAIVMEGPGLPERVVQLGAVPHVLDIRRVSCLRIEPIASKEVQDEFCIAANWPLYSLTFLRIPGFFGRDGSSATPNPESDVCRWWFETVGAEEKRNAAFYCSWGRTEFVIMRGANSPGDICEWITRIKPEDGSVVQTLSIIGVNPDCIEADSKLEPSPNKPTESKLRLQIGLACRPQHRDLMRKFALETFSTDSKQTGIDTDLLPGETDLSLLINLQKSLCWQEAIKRLLFLREHACKLLLGTSAAFLFPPIDTDAEPSDHADGSSSSEKRWTKAVTRASEETASSDSDGLRFSLSAKHARSIFALPDVGPFIVQTMYVFGDLLAHELNNGELLDMLPYFASFRKQSLLTESSNQQALRSLAKRWQSAQRGMEQRTPSERDGISPLGGTIRHLLGGLNRVLQAAESIPLSLFRQSRGGTLWPGFVVIGPPRSYYGTEDCTISLPVDYVWSPNRWTSLIHESAHNMLLRFRDIADVGLDKAIKECRHLIRKLDEQTHGPDPLRRSRSTAAHPMDSLLRDDSIVEILVDLIQASYGPWWNPKLVVAGALENIHAAIGQQSLGNGQSSTMLLRILVVSYCARHKLLARPAKAGYGERQSYAYALESRSPREELFDSIQLASDSVQTWIVGLFERFVSGDSGSFTTEADLLCLLRSCEPIVELATRVFPFTDEQMTKRRQWFDTGLDEWMKSVETGIFTLTDDSLTDIRWPELFLWRLRSRFEGKNDMTFPQKSAAILGLVRSFRNTYSYFRDRQSDYNE